MHLAEIREVLLATLFASFFDHEFTINRCMKTHKKFMRDIMTGADGTSYDIVRFLWLLSSVVYMGLTFYAIYKGNYTFDPILWGSGMAALAGGYGASIYAKAGTEPQASLMVKTDKVTFKQAVGRPLPEDGDSDSPCPSDGASDAPGPADDDSASASATTTTTTKGPTK